MSTKCQRVKVQNFTLICKQEVPVFSKTIFAAKMFTFPPAMAGIHSVALLVSRLPENTEFLAMRCMRRCLLRQENSAMLKKLLANRRLVVIFSTKMTGSQ